MQLSSASEELALSKISDFKRGYAHFLNQFTNLASGLMNFLASSTVTEATKRELIPYRKEIDSGILKTTQMAKDLLLELDEKHLAPAARKDLASYFKDGFQESHRVDYVMFHLTFEALRYFYLQAKESWTSIQYTVLSANLTDINFKTEAILEYRILPVIDKLNSLKILLERMAIILSIEDIHLLFKVKQCKPEYSEKQIYKLSSVFQNGLQKFMDDDLIPVNILPPTEELEKSKPKSPKIDKKPTEKKPESINTINTAGKMSWNNNQYYFFRYEIDKLEEERQLFKSVINLDTHLGADEKALRAEMLRGMSSKDTKSRNPELYEEKYMIFLDSFFEFCRSILILGMGIPESLKFLFFYHIGPNHFYLVVRKFLQEANTGYLHIRSNDGKTVTRILPSEIIKKQVVAFWNREILPNIGEERDNLGALKKIIEIVDIKYKEVSLHAIQEYEALSLDEKNSKPRVQIFRERMNTWMGAANIIVFKRFLKTVG